MKPRQARVILWGAAIALLAAGSYLVWGHLWRAQDNRVYVIGWQNSAPFQQRGAGGLPAGLVIDLVRDAALRRGIQLKWVWHPEGPDAPLRNRQVDLWPLITITPERQAVIHISKPYLQHLYGLMVPATSAYSQLQDLATASIANLGIAIDRRSLGRLLPHARLVTAASGEEAIQNVCTGRTDAAFLNEFTANAALLNGGACSSQPLRVIPVQALRTELGVGSTLEASAVADEIRRGIGASVLEGDLANILQSGGYFSSRDMQYFTALLDAQQRENRLRLTVIVFACLLGLTVFTADRIRRQRNQMRATEWALRQSEQRFRELLEGVKLVAIMTDRSGAISFWNDYAAALTGWSKEEVIGLPAKDFLDLEPPRRETHEMARGSVVVTDPLYEGSILQKNGDRRWIQWSSTRLRDSAGRTAGLASLGEDVTELRRLRAEAARLEGEEQFRNIADTTPLMIWTAGPDMGCSFVNKAWLDFTGHIPDQELGSGWTNNIHPEDFEHVRTNYLTAFEARRNVELEYRKRRADGEYRWVLGSGLPRFGTDGQFAGYFGACIDITDLKLRRDEDIARQKLEGVGRLAGGIAHDFNNLLGAILAQADLALAEAIAGEPPQEELNNICAIAIRGAGIVRQLMIYAGHESITSEPVDISWLVDDMRDLLKVLVSKRVVLKTELDRNLPPVQANPTQIRQVVINLATNASEAIGGRDGTIVIRTARSEVRQNGTRAHAIDWIELEVSDTGRGIGSCTQSKLFDPTFTTKSVGHGLGLAVVHTIIEALGGSIHVESEAGRGSAFRVLLPSSTGIAPLPHLARAHPTPEELHHETTVLVVEDEEPLRLATVKTLRARGFSVLEAADGNEALASVRAHKDTIGSILLDVTLPGAPSSEVLAEARRLRSNIKVIVTSAYGADMVAESFPGMEIDSFLRKPYRAVELVNVIARLTSVENSRP